MGENFPYGVWRDESDDPGHRAEVCLKKVLQGYAELGILDEVPPDCYGQKLKKDAFFRSTPQADFEEGYDFAYYDSRNDHWVRIDLTTIADRTRRYDKRDKERERDIRELFIPLHILEKAAQSRPTMEEPNQFQSEVLRELSYAVRH